MDVVRRFVFSAIKSLLTPAPSRTGTTIQPSPDLVDVISINNRYSAARKMSDIVAQPDNLSGTPDLKDVHNESTRRLKIRLLKLSLTDKIAKC